MTASTPDLARPRTRRGVLFIVLKVALSAGLLAWILSRPELDTLGPLMSGMDVRWILAGFACAGLSVWLLAWRWQACLRAVGLHLPMPEVFRITLAASAAGYFSVGTLGTDTAKVFLVARRCAGLACCRDRLARHRSRQLDPGHGGPPDAGARPARPDARH